MPLCGAPTNQREANAEEQEIYRNLHADVLTQAGAEGEAEIVSVATQVVNGINYIFQVRIAEQPYEVTIYRAAAPPAPPKVTKVERK